MCGILGIIQKTPIEEQTFERSFEPLKPRGRDEYRYALSPNEHYGYMRLPTDGISPFAHRHLTNMLFPLTLFNGIVTNTRQLAKEFGLEEKCAEYDTHTLQEGFIRYGPPILNRVRGMFALAHITEESVVLARDTAGIKPLYYCFDDDLFAFASEIKALHHLARSRIHEVRPGEIVVFDKGTRSVTKRSIAYQPNVPRTLEKQFIESLVQPTERYLSQSEKQVGLLLSGGLDSSILLGLLARHLSPDMFARIHCFSIGVSDADDTRAAESIASTFNARLSHVPLPSDAQSLDALPRIVHAIESPYARAAKVGILQDSLAHAVKRENIDVVISGEGADELFYGYRKFIDGLSFTEIDEAYAVFFKDMFPQTLLQRLDRVFARHCIEGRVPFLDQEIIVYACRVPSHEKITRDGDSVRTKAPLRELARALGIPSDIAEREKMPMLHGSTTQTNTEESGGYLEDYCLQKTGMTCTELVQKLYLERFGRTIDPLTGTSRFDMRARELSLAETLRAKSQI